MQPLVSTTIDVNALIDATQREAHYQRFWLPPEPWWAKLTADADSFASAVHRKLARGVSWPKSQVVDVRKPGHGVRPVSVMSPEVRIAYRAIVSAIVPFEDRIARNATNYANFVLEPIRAAYDGHEGLRIIGESKYAYIVSADIAAFYQYIDHSILREELDLVGGDLQLIDSLTNLLADIEGRAFGIPQRSAPSDWISEFYAARLARQVVRDGFDVWHYSDDFRVGCRSYSDALAAIESLARAARDVGLVLNDQKTFTPSFLKYLMQNADVEINDASEEIDPSDVEAAVSSDYTPDGDEQAIEEAHDTIDMVADLGDAVASDPDDGWNLRHLSADQHRAVRRAMNTLTKHGDPQAVPHLLDMLAYQPAMTHVVIRYATSLSWEESEAVEDLLEKVITRLSLNEWQRAWIAYGLRACDVPLSNQAGRQRWLEQQLAARPASMAAAEAAVTLSMEGLISYASLDDRLRTTSPDFMPWYLYGVSQLHQQGAIGTSQVGALRSSSPMANAILK